MKHIARFLVFTILMMAAAAWAFPGTLNFQGMLQDADGIPVNDNKIVQFRIYDVPTGGTPIWSEYHNSVSIQDGLFAVELGSETAFPDGLFANENLFITFFVGGEEMSPRQKFLPVPYSLQSASLEGVPLSGLVQQDEDGNAVVSGTMTADAFLGDGSGLTGITALYDDTFLHKQRPDTLTTNSTVAALNIINSGSGAGMKVDSNGDGVYVYSAGNPTTTYSSTAKNGFEVEGAEGNGLFVGRADYSGVNVFSAGMDGVNIYKAGNPSSTNYSTAKNGFEVAGSEGNGLYVGRADNYGVQVNSTGSDGVFVSTAGHNGFFVLKAGNITSTVQSSGKNGFEVAGAENNGLFVGKANNDGVNVYSAGDDGVYVFKAGNPTTTYSSTAKNGFEVEGAEGNGLFVGRADNCGVLINSAGLDGVKVLDSTWKGVYANTSNANGEWGLYSEDKIYGSNLTTRSLSTHVRNTGEQSLEAGDLVCLAGGYQQNVLGDDDGQLLVHVRKADESGSQSVFGVVEYKVYIREEVEATEAGMIVSRCFQSAAGSAGYGEYLAVVVFGPAEVKVAAG